MVPSPAFPNLKQEPTDIIRLGGRVERACEHGVGHCIGHTTQWEDWMSIHGCDGCCAAWQEERTGDQTV